MMLWKMMTRGIFSSHHFTFVAFFYGKKKSLSPSKSLQFWIASRQWYLSVSYLFYITKNVLSNININEISMRVHANFVLQLCLCSPTFVMFITVWSKCWSNEICSQSITKSLLPHSVAYFGWFLESTSACNLV